MIVILFFCRILSLSSSPLVSMRDLTPTIAVYFTLPTGSTGRIVDSIRHAFFHVDNIQDIGLLDSSGKLTMVSDIVNRVVDIVFFTFRSTVMASDIDHHFSSPTLSFDFSLRLPQRVDSTVTLPVFNLHANNLAPPSVAKPASFFSPVSRPFLTFTLENAMDDVLTSMNTAKLRQFMIDARDPSNLSPRVTKTIPPNRSPSITTPKPNCLLPFISSPTSSISKMDRVWSSGVSGGLTTYLDLLISWITSGFLILFSVPTLSFFVYLNGRWVHVPSRTLTI